MFLDILVSIGSIESILLFKYSVFPIPFRITAPDFSRNFQDPHLPLIRTFSGFWDCCIVILPVGQQPQDLAIPISGRPHLHLFDIHLHMEFFFDLSGNILGAAVFLRSVRLHTLRRGAVDPERQSAAIIQFQL